MRIMIITHDIPPYCEVVGSVQRVTFLSDYLSMRGHEILLVGDYKDVDNISGAAWYDDILRNISLCPVKPILFIKYWNQLKERIARKPNTNPNEGSTKRDREGNFISLIRNMVGSMYGFICTNIILDYNSILQMPAYRKEISRLISKFSPDALVLSVPPHGMLRLVPWLRSKHKHLRLFIDFRDGLTSSHIFRAKWSLRLMLQRNLEKAALSSADGIVFATPGIERYYLKEYSSRIKKSVVVLNGYTEGLWPDTGSTRKDNHHYTIKYVGVSALYRDSYTSPSLLFDVIDDCLERQILSYDDLAISFVGRTWGEDMIEKFPNAKMITTFKKQVSPIEAHKEMLSADALLLIHSHKVGSEEVLTGKLFDYLRAGKVIIYLTADNCGIKTFLDDLGAGIWLNIEDKEQIRAQILRLVKTFKEGDWDILSKRNVLDSDRLAVYSRESQNGKFEEFVSAIVHQGAYGSVSNNVHSQKIRCDN